MTNSRIAKSGVNIATAIAQNVLNIFLVFIARIIFVKVLDVSYLGINGLFTNILNILSLADMGINTAMMYSLYKPLAENNQKKICSLVSYFRKVYLAIAGIITILGIMIMPFLKLIIRLEHPVDFLYGYYLLALANVVVSYLFIYRTTLMIADQKSYILNNYIMVFRIVTFVLQTIVLIFFKNYFIYLLMALIVNVFSNFTQNAIVVKQYSFLKQKALPIDCNEKKEIKKNVIALFYQKVGGVVLNDTDNILISIMIGTIYVGYYSNYVAVINAVTLLVSAVFNAVKSSVGNMVADEKDNVEKSLQIFWILFFINFWIVSFTSVVLYCILNDFICIAFGESFVLSQSVVMVIVGQFYSVNISQTIWVYRETTGFFDETKQIRLITALINLIVSIILGGIFGILGILGGTILAKIVYSWWREPEILFNKYFGISSKKFLVKDMKYFFITLMLGFVTCMVCDKICVANILLRLVVKLCVCCIIPNIVILIVFWKGQEMNFIMHNIIQPIKLIIKKSGR